MVAMPFSDHEIISGNAEARIEFKLIFFIRLMLMTTELEIAKP